MVCSRDLQFEIPSVLIVLMALINLLTNFFLLIAIFDNYMLFGLNMFFKDWNSNHEWDMIGNKSLFRVNEVFVELF